MHRRRTERPRTHKKGEFEIMSYESSSLPIFTQEMLLCSITTFQSDARRGSVQTHLLCWLVTPTGYQGWRVKIKVIQNQSLLWVHWKYLWMPGMCQGSENKCGSFLCKKIFKGNQCSRGEAMLWISWILMSFARQNFSLWWFSAFSKFVKGNQSWKLLCCHEQFLFICHERAVVVV